MQAAAIVAVGFLLMIAVGCVVFVVGAIAAIRGDNRFRIRIKVLRLFSYDITRYGKEDSRRQSLSSPHPGEVPSTTRDDQGPTM